MQASSKPNPAEAVPIERSNSLRKRDICEVDVPNPVGILAASSGLLKASSGHFPISVSCLPQPGCPIPLKFTINDLDALLYGKQELEVVQFGEPAHSQSSKALPASKSVGQTCNSSKDQVHDEKRRPAKWCDLCQEVRFGECPRHGPLPCLQPISSISGMKSYAMSTFPEEVGLCISSIPVSGYGVYARHFIPVGTWIGPYEGRKLDAREGLRTIQQRDAPFMWEIYESFHLSHFLDASDENSSSWMRFIQCARHRGEQNLFVFQYYGSIYYRAFKDIPVGAELLVWYDDKYPQYFGIPYDIRDMSSFSVQSIQSTMGDSGQAGFAKVQTALKKSENISPPFSDSQPWQSLLTMTNGEPSGSAISGLSRFPFHERKEVPLAPNRIGDCQMQSFIASSAMQLTSQLIQSAGVPLDDSGHQLVFANSRTSKTPMCGSPRPGFRSDFTSSIMLRSMSADDLRKQKSPVFDRSTRSAVGQAPVKAPRSQTFKTSAVYPSLPLFARQPLTSSRENASEMPYQRVRDATSSLDARGDAVDGVQDNCSYACQDCGQSFSRKDSYESHGCASEASDAFQCGRCQLSFLDALALQEHMVTHDGARPFTCAICSLGFFSVVALNSHVRCHSKEPDLLGENTQTSAIKCSKCRKCFAHALDYNFHSVNGDCAS